MRLNIKHACGHWKKWEFLGTADERAPQILKKRGKRCPKCVAIETAIETAQAIMSEPRRRLRPAA